MAMFMFGARHNGEDISHEFINNGVACVGWDNKEAPGLHQMLHSIKMGDFVCIKSFSPSNGLYIKAIGIVTSPFVKSRNGSFPLGEGRKVKWLWHADDCNDVIVVGNSGDKADNMRRGTLYEEWNPRIIRKVLRKIS